ncbi:MAG: hypothetical protein WCQ32_00675 [bacterium]
MQKSIEKLYREKMPYGFKKIESNKYICFNRDYVTIQNDITITEKEITLIKTNEHNDTFFIYNDKNSPWLNKKNRNIYDEKIKSVPSLNWLF